ncbi:hypothetical protein FYJ79_05095 [Sharpea azabuensis]|uniref:Uncharacterized protein n=1 Tax=Sharpea porci TaxID=2652286 RepID=A0A844FSR6_9FIRM|nr:hypothetical protein [Sharpea porci]MST88957.1 hypothetical protein [Sharpea porci]
MLSDYARTTPIFKINQPLREIYPEMHDIRSLLVKAYDIIEECLTPEGIYTKEPLDLENLPFFIGDQEYTRNRTSIYAYCHFESEYFQNHVIKYPQYIFINRYLLENTVDENVCLGILIHEILHATIYDVDNYSYDDNGNIIGAHHGIWRERANLIHSCYPDIDVLFDYSEDELYEHGVNRHSCSQVMFAYSNTKSVDDYIFIDDRFYHIRDHIKAFVESIGMSDMLK